jgi:hypothetical protein
MGPAIEKTGMRSVVWALAAAFWGTAWAAAALADDATAQRQSHPWGVFDLGAWKVVRIQTESFDEKGKVSAINVSDTKTSLLDDDDDNLSLEVRACVEVGGRRFDSEPQTIKQNLFGETSNAKIKDPVAGEVTIEDRKIPCQIREIESSDANGRTVTKVFYSTSVAPYLLKRESVTTDLERKNTLSETHVAVQSLDMPYKILGCLRTASYVKTVQKTPKGTVVTLAVTCPEVPGGIVSHSSKELDTSGRLVRRSVLELVDYSAEPEKERSGIFRKRPNRYRGKD